MSGDSSRACTVSGMALANGIEGIVARICPEYQASMRALVGIMLAEGESNCLQTVRLCHGGDDENWVSARVRIERQGGRPTSVVATVLAYD